MAEVTRIVRLGHRGDGLAETGRHVPFTLPGELVAVAPKGPDRGQPLEILEPSPARVAPVCPHFGRCGGCALQHMAAPAYLDWKRAQVAAALATRGLEPELRPVHPIPLYSRRRAVLSAARVNGAVRLGYHARLSHDFVEAGPCPILTPAVERRLPDLAELVAPLLDTRGELRVTVLDAASGLDVAVTGGRPVNAPALRAALARRSAECGIARLTVADETLVAHRTPALDIGGVPVTPAPGGFVQAVAAAEAAMADLVQEAVGDARSLADLFAGIGTFALRLAHRARVTAVEGDDAAAAALDQARRRASGLKPVVVVTRDLERRPLVAAELKDFDAVVFDPPRAGSKAQCERLAASRVPTVAAVSCNVASFARDARILVDGGYRLAWVAPVDQFLFSPHIELVAAFRR